MTEASTAVNGKCDNRFVAVQEKFKEFLALGRDLGASICVNLDGVNVVDIWGGYANADRTKKWEENTIANVWSTSKPVTSLAALLLIDRGLIDPDAKVSKYWPEFAVNGKEDVLVRHLLCHASGLSGWQEPIAVEDVFDTEKSTRLLAEQAPWWTPGTQSGYHSLTMGHVIAPLIKSVTGKSLKQFIQDELADPLNADYQLGARESDWNRVAEIIPPPPFDPGTALSDDFKDPTSVIFKTFTNPPMGASIANTDGWRRAEIGAGNGHANARGVARILSPISLGGTVDGTHFLSQSTIDKIFETQTLGKDLVIGKTVRYGLGFGISTPDRARDDTTFPDWVPAGRIATWGGWGGSVAVMDVDRRLTIAYVMNRMESPVLESEKGKGESERLMEYVRLVYEALGVV